MDLTNFNGFSKNGKSYNSDEIIFEDSEDYKEYKKFTFKKMLIFEILFVGIAYFI